MIVDEVYPDSGRIRLGPQVKLAYLPQIIHFDHPDWNLVENMMAAKRGISAQSARNRLAAYDFRGEDVLKPVSVLSGGEQSRLRLCMLMDDEINFLNPGRAYQPSGHCFQRVDRGSGGGL